MTVPAGVSAKAEFTGDVVIRKGEWLRGKTIFDVAEEMGPEDMYFKGANAVDLRAVPVSAGGVLGAEGCTYFVAEGSAEELDSLKQVLEEVKKEPPFRL